MKSTTQVVAMLLAFAVAFSVSLNAEVHTVVKARNIDPCCELVKELSSHKVVRFDIKLRRSFPVTFDESRWKEYKKLFKGTQYDSLYPFNLDEGLYTERRYYLSSDSLKYLSVGVVESGAGGTDFYVVAALIENHKVSCAFCAAHYSASNDGEAYLSSKIVQGKLVWKLEVPSIVALRAYGKLLSPVCE